MKFMLPNVDEIIKKYNLKQVTSPTLYNAEFKPETLFSEDIFGSLGSDERYSNFAYIDLQGEYVHPAVYDIIKKSSKLLYHGLLGTKPLKITNNQLVIDEAEGLHGIELFKQILKNKDSLKNLSARIKALLERYQDKTIISKILVIPPAFRPINYVNGRPIPDPLNEVYSQLIILTSYGATTQFQLVQESLWNLFEKFKGLLSKKSGLIRGEILGKRLDFTARGAITSDPDLPSDTVGVPYVMLGQIAMPFIVYQLKRGYSDKYRKPFKQVLEEVGIPITQNALQTILVKFSNNLLTDEKLVTIIKEAINLAIQHKVVLIKRDPALHQYSWEAMKVVPVEGYSIRMSHAYLAPLGADFDGDSVAGTDVTLYTFINNQLHSATTNIEKVKDLTLNDFTNNGDEL